MNTRILVVEDSPEFQLLVRRSLADAGHDVECVTTSGEAMAAGTQNSFDLIILDVSLPDEDGFRLCARLQSAEATRGVPIFFLTGRGDVVDKVMAFSLGADDYIVKPFDPLELRARVEAKLAKRVRQPEWGERMVTRGRLKLDLAMQRAFLCEPGPDGKGGEANSEIDTGLTPVEFKLLRHLVRHEGRVFSRAQLLNAVWGNELEVVAQNIYTHISSLRRKLSGCGCYVESVPHQGYRFVLPRAS